MRGVFDGEDAMWLLRGRPHSPEKNLVLALSRAVSTAFRASEGTAAVVKFKTFEGNTGLSRRGTYGIALMDFSVRFLMGTQNSTVAETKAQG